MNEGADNYLAPSFLFVYLPVRMQRLRLFQVNIFTDLAQIIIQNN
jgi:hypothetical protein